MSIIETQVTVMCSALVACQPVVSVLMSKRLFNKTSITRNALEENDERVHPFQSLSEDHVLQPYIHSAQLASDNSTVAFH